eukprot:TRINITY_DN2995_c0_g1_i1.p1 TRINITY_DN2995_c0_g1~~TRINITY_DN2995_c0_g1_i1.p1  ORF type:complete len:2209 (+),score=622.06 TRINITY_DN2995_c0_g1_i1:78-6704(+)
MLPFRRDSRGETARKANMSTPAQFVEKCGGTTVINKILLANNGIGAVKFIRSIRLWAYEVFGNERAIELFTMATPEDIKGNAEFIKLADQYVPVPGGSNNNNYANVDLIVDIAQRIKADAVWAGWGHASENPLLPDKLFKHRIAFLGPPGNAMRSLGDKISSSVVAQSADVPTLPWNGMDLTLNVDDLAPGQVISVSDEMYKKGVVYTAAEGLAACERIGYPVMIKASEGGGGKGIRKVLSGDNFATMFRQVQAEVPGSPVFVMKLATQSRHLEVQLLADQYGNAISLLGRDCSIQRRHQKIIEEAPATHSAAPDIFHKMELAAVRLAKLVGYVSAGTVEYLYTDEGFYFLELNPRLQVEHPCTEMVTNVNLPSCQLQVAMGIPLHRIADIRTFYGFDRWGDSKIDFMNPVNPPQPHGHVIAARITAENPDEGFKPTSGAMTELNFRSMNNVWGYFSVSASGGLHEFADSQFGHIFAWGMNREQARQNLVMALKQVSIRGDFRTTLEYLIKLMETPAFRSNTLDTAWLDKLIADKVKADPPHAITAVICTSAFLAHEKLQAIIENYRLALVRGQIPAKNEYRQGPHTCSLEMVLDGFKYKVTVTRTGPNTFTLALNNSYVDVDIHLLTDGGRLVLLNGRSHVTYVTDEVTHYRAVIDTKTAIFEKENDPSVLRTTSPGKLVRYLIPADAHVNEGEPYVEVEVMKMVLTLPANSSGVIQHTKQAGAVLQTGDVLAHLILDDPTKVKQILSYTGTFPEELSVSGGGVHGERLQQLFQSTLTSFQNIFNGYLSPKYATLIHKLTRDLASTLQNPALPLCELREVVASLMSRIPITLLNDIKSLMNTYEDAMTSLFSHFPAQEIKDLVSAHAEKISNADEQAGEFEAQAFRVALEPIVALCSRYEQGVRGHGHAVVTNLLTQFLEVEELFDADREGMENERLTRPQPDSELQIFEKLREQYREDLDKLLNVVVAHWSTLQRPAAALSLVGWLATFSSLTDSELSILDRLSNLRAPANAQVALASRKLLISRNSPSFQQRRMDMEAALEQAVEHHDAAQKLHDLVNAPATSFDTLTTFFYHRLAPIRVAALEIYIRRSYAAHVLERIRHHKALNLSSMASVVEFSFSSRRMPFPFSAIGLFVTLETLKDFGKDLSVILDTLPPSDDRSVKRILHVVVRNFDSLSEFTNDAARSVFLASIVENARPQLSLNGVARLTLCLLVPKSMPLYYTFSKELDWAEDSIYRHLEPGLAYQLELDRLSNYQVQLCSTGNSTREHIYYGEASLQTGGIDKRFFIRTSVHHADLISYEASVEYWSFEAERIVVDCISSLEMVSSDPKYKGADSNHLFLNFLPVMTMDLEKVNASVVRILMKHGERFYRLRVTDGEVIASIRASPDAPVKRVRWLIHNEAGFIQGNTLKVYQVSDDLTASAELQHLQPILGTQGPSTNVSIPYPVASPLQRKRYLAQLRGTSYVYDYIAMFAKSIGSAWKSAGRKKPSEEAMLSATELTVGADGTLQTIERDFGKNKVGMVAWKMTWRTPEYPEGRQVIVIANDITVDAGSFSVNEDALFNLASRYAREEGIPRIYVSVNSGARIGLADEVKNAFKIAWNVPNDESKGFKYLYLSPEDYKKLTSAPTGPSVICKKVEEDGEERYVITDIIGSKHGLGVENLQGSGLIAGETSQAYKEIVTLSLVTGRTVGIGSYLVRLGQRVIQVESSSIILTGAAALNKVLGRDVYGSNLQIGGPQIMHHNGMSHLVVKHDLEGVRALVDWLSFVPKKTGAPLPILPSVDPIERKITFKPSSQPYDPRWMLTGRFNDAGVVETGFFDKGSWSEVLSQWATNLVTGRARLGGVPVGCIAVETRTMNLTIPADPAAPDSESQVIPQPGQVWFPNSAYKTAQAIADFNKESLPLIIFANWRGFSGGQRDMYNEVLKYGAMIVDQLREYKQPVFIYIPPAAELRGGAWVVVDPTINTDMMEMYADVESRGGVLEPSGTVQIKFREKDLKKSMLRLDPTYAELSDQLAALDASASEEETTKLKKELEARLRSIYPVYHQAAEKFADLHDTSGRMKAKGVIREVVKWEDARTIFAHRLRRRVEEEQLVNQLVDGAEKMTRAAALDALKQQFLSASNGEKQTESLWEDDKAVSSWLQTNASELKKWVASVTNSSKWTVATDLIGSLLNEGDNDATAKLLALLKSQDPELLSSLKASLADA